MATEHEEYVGKFVWLVIAALVLGSNFAFYWLAVSILRACLGPTL